MNVETGHVVEVRNKPFEHDNIQIRLLKRLYYIRHWNCPESKNDLLC